MMMFYLNDYKMLSVKELIISALPISMIKALVGCFAESWGSIFPNIQVVSITELQETSHQN